MNKHFVIIFLTFLMTIVSFSAIAVLEAKLPMGHDLVMSAFCLGIILTGSFIAIALRFAKDGGQ